jgi:hypothetical protein
MDTSNGSIGIFLFDKKLLLTKSNHSTSMNMISKQYH